MLRYIVVLLLLLPFIDFYVLIKVAETVGLLETVVFSIATGVIGATLIRREGRYVMRKLQRSVTGAEVTRNFAEGALLVICGLMLLSPGFVTDALGAIAAFRPVRERAVARLTQRFSGSIEIEMQAF
ncbi:MAG: FxsA family protein [Candidatus Nanohalobium sp.]